MNLYDNVGANNNIAPLQHNNASTLSSISLSYITERRERDGEMRGEPRD
jgi:hypothetical protein